MDGVATFLFFVGEGFGRSLIVLVLPLALSVFSLYVISKALKEKFFESEVIGHGLVFGILGLAVAYLYVAGGDGFTSLLPHLIVAITVIFQLLGNMMKQLESPLASRATLVAAATGAFMFLFGTGYFESLFVDKVLTQREFVAQN